MLTIQTDVDPMGALVLALALVQILATRLTMSLSWAKKYLGT